MAGLTAATVRARTPATPQVSPQKLAILAFAGVSLLACLLGALALLGFPGPGPTAQLAGAHGLLMTMGFLGTVISLERAVALGRTWGFVAPVATGLAGPALVVDGPAIVATSLIAVASIVYLAMYLLFLGMDRALHIWVQAAGAVGWLLATALLQAGRPVGDAVLALAVLLILTVAGERLELARLLVLTPTRRALFLAAAGASLRAWCWLHGSRTRAPGLGAPRSSGWPPGSPGSILPGGRFGSQGSRGSSRFASSPGMSGWPSAARRGWRLAPRRPRSPGTRCATRSSSAS